MDKKEILEQLKKEGVTDLNGLADFLVKKTHQDGKPGGPVINAAIIASHGFVSH